MVLASCIGHSSAVLKEGLPPLSAVSHVMLDPCFAICMPKHIVLRSLVLCSSINKYIFLEDWYEEWLPAVHKNTLKYQSFSGGMLLPSERNIKDIIIWGL
jgi:hypothetical protein